MVVVMMVVVVALKIAQMVVQEDSSHQAAATQPNATPAHGGSSSCNPSASRHVVEVSCLSRRRVAGRERDGWLSVNTRRLLLLAAPAANPLRLGLTS